MNVLMPQEMEVFYLLPALRKKIADILINDFGTKQKDVAQYFGVGKSTISQYRSSQRGGELDFNKDELDLIQQAAESIHKNPTLCKQILYDLSVALRGKEAMCTLHKKLDASLPDKCDLCSKHFTAG